MTNEAIFAAMEPHDPGQFATFVTPLIRNCWYVGARSDEVGRKLLSRRLLGNDVVLYRTEDGEPVALRNRCPHRSFPLARGTLQGDRIVCGYHGMQFDPDGLCASMPAMSTTPSTVTVRSYPTVERGPIVWIWLGSPGLADESLIPNTDWLTNSLWGTVGGKFHINADYVSMHENLIDQSHFPFLHPDTVGTPAYARSRLLVSTENDQVVIRRELPQSPPPVVYGEPAGIMHKLVDRISEARFVSPAMHVAFAEILDNEPSPESPSRYRYNISHFFTPETNTSIHYWWFNSRDFRPGDTKIDDFLESASTQAYSEDVAALEWIMDTVRNDADPQIELSFAPDKPGLMARRILFRLSRKEN